MKTKSSTPLIDPSFNLNQVSWKVFFALQGRTIQSSNVGVTVAPWYNGRERGFCLVVAPEAFSKNAMHIAWAENRNSDQIVVYEWEARVGMNPVSSGDVPGDAWKSAKYFDGDADGIVEAAQHIFESASSFAKKIGK